MSGRKAPEPSESEHVLDENAVGFACRAMFAHMKCDAGQGQLRERYFEALFRLVIAENGRWLREIQIGEEFQQGCTLPVIEHIVHEFHFFHRLNGVVCFSSDLAVGLAGFPGELGFEFIGD
jgi:hypothetical protein